MLKITLVRSIIGRPESQRKTVRSLGLGKLKSTSVLPDSPSLRGQIRKVQHLVQVEKVEEGSE